MYKSEGKGIIVRNYIFDCNYCFIIFFFQYLHLFEITIFLYKRKSCELVVVLVTINRMYFGFDRFRIRTEFFCFWTCKGSRTVNENMSKKTVLIDLFPRHMHKRDTSIYLYHMREAHFVV